MKVAHALEPDRVDPYLRAAMTTGFVDYGVPGRVTTNSLLIGLELKPRAKGLKQHLLGPIKGMTLQDAYKGSRFRTARVTLDAYAKLLAHPDVDRIVFAEPLVPRRPRPRVALPPPAIAPQAMPSPKERRGEVLLGMIDNGCPFAHHQFRLGKAGTRILRLWHQDGLATPEGTPPPPEGFTNGSELTRSDLEALMAASSASGSIDEGHCYRLAGYAQLAHRESHGSHSLGLLAAAQRWTSRFGGRSPAIQMPDGAASVTSDIVFVQLPQHLLDCVSVTGLECSAMDGLRYIYGVGKAQEHKRIVVSFGYESWLGPHDGTSWFEAALDDLIAEATEAHIELQVHMVAGNSKNRTVHAALKCSQAERVVNCFVPPGTEVPTFIEVWVPPGQDTLRLQVRPPGMGDMPEIWSQWGEITSWPSDKHSQFNVVMRKSDVLGKGGSVILIRVAPTQAFDASEAASPHGVWMLKFNDIRRDESSIHVRVGRIAADSNAPRRGLQPYLVGRTEDDRATDLEQTLNGHACGQSGRVAGVYYGQEFPYLNAAVQAGPGCAVVIRTLRGLSTPYSGAGPTGGTKRQPDISLPMEDGLLCAGVLSTGTRSGCVYRMMGTSTAAPAAAQGAADRRPRTRTGPPPRGQPTDPAVGRELESPFGDQ